MKNQAMNPSEGAQAGDTRFEWVIWFLVGSLLVMFLTTAAAVVYGYLQFLS